MMKSRRLRLDDGARQKMPRLQMSPTCIGVVVTWVVAHVARDGPRLRFTDCAAYRFQLHAGGYVVGFPLSGPGPAHPPGRNLPVASVGSISFVCSHPTDTWPGAAAAIVGKTSVPGALEGSTSYACAALPGIRPPPPSH